MQIVKSVILSKYLLIIDCQLEKNQNLVLTVKRLRQLIGTDSNTNRTF